MMPNARYGNNAFTERNRQASQTQGRFGGGVNNRHGRAPNPTYNSLPGVPIPAPPPQQPTYGTPVFANGQVRGTGIPIAAPAAVSPTTGTGRPAVVGGNTSNTGGGGGGGDAATGGTDAGAGSGSDSGMTGTPFSMYGTTYSAVDLDNMLSDPRLFLSEWLRTQGQGTPAAASRLSGFAQVMPMLQTLLQGDRPFLQTDEAGNVVGDELQAVQTAGLFQQLLEGVTTPGGYQPNGMDMISTLLATPALNADNEGTPTYLQGATQLGADGSNATAADQAANTNALMNAAMLFNAPGMRNLAAGLLNWMGQQYLSANLDARTQAEGGTGTKQPYVAWLAENSRNYGVM